MPSGNSEGFAKRSLCLKAEDIDLTLQEVGIRAAVFRNSSQISISDAATRPGSSNEHGDPPWPRPRGSRGLRTGTFVRASALVSQAPMNKPAQSALEILAR